MSFDVIIFVAALWALSSEMIEDSLVDLIYGHMFGWRNLIYALVAASLILTAVFSTFVYYASFLLIAYIELISKGAAVLLGAIGVFWLSTSILLQGREESEAGVRYKRGVRMTFLVALQLVSVEELEVFLIIVPLVLASHALEATSAAAIGIVASVSLAALLKKNFERLIVGRMRYLKIISGLFLVTLGIVLFLES